jgi:hypothetical protein
LHIFSYVVVFFFVLEASSRVYLRSEEERKQRGFQCKIKKILVVVNLYFVQKNY